MPGPYAITDQLGNVVYDPFLKQVQYHQARERYRLFGGSKGCGKSKALRFDHHLFHLAVPNSRGLITRRQLTELQRSHIRELPREIQALGGEPAGFKWKPSDVGAGVLYYPNGSTLEFGHLQYDESVETYLSAQYERLSMDEIVTNTEYQHLMLCSCLRTTIPGVIPQFGAATNPGGKHGRWVKRRWVDKDLTSEEDEVYRPEDYLYIPALPSDNPFLNWEEYNRELSRLPPDLRRAYRDGDWDCFSGQFFGEFQRSRLNKDTGVLEPWHVLGEDELERYSLGPSFLRDFGCDWGYGHEGYAGWSVVHPDGTLVWDDELVFNGPHRSKHVAREVAEQVLQRTKERGWQLNKALCDPKMDDQTGHETGETLMETWQKAGVPVRPADNDRINGWARLRAWLRPNPATGKPFLRLHPRCTYLIRTFSEVMMDEHKLEDVETDGPDHGVDVARYCVMGRPAPAELQVVQRFPPGSVGWLRQQALKEQRERAGRTHLGSSNKSQRRGRYA